MPYNGHSSWHHEYIISNCRYLRLSFQWVFYFHSFTLCDYSCNALLIRNALKTRVKVTKSRKAKQIQQTTKVFTGSYPRTSAVVSYLQKRNHFGLEYWRIGRQFPARRRTKEYRTSVLTFPWTYSRLRIIPLIIQGKLSIPLKSCYKGFSLLPSWS